MLPKTVVLEPRGISPNWASDEMSDPAACTFIVTTTLTLNIVNNPYKLYDDATVTVTPLPENRQYRLPAEPDALPAGSSAVPSVGGAAIPEIGHTSCCGMPVVCVRTYPSVNP